MEADESHNPSMVDKRVRLAVRHPWRPMKAIIPLWLTNDEVRSIHRDDERRNRILCRCGLVTGRRLAVKNQALEWIGLLFVAVEIATEY